MPVSEPVSADVYVAQYVRATAPYTDRCRREQSRALACPDDVVVCTSVNCSLASRDTSLLSTRPSVYR